MRADSTPEIRVPIGAVTVAKGGTLDVCVCHTNGTHSPSIEVSRIREGHMPIRVRLPLPLAPDVRAFIGLAEEEAEKYARRDVRKARAERAAEPVWTGHHARMPIMSGGTLSKRREARRDENLVNAERIPTVTEALSADGHVATWVRATDEEGGG